MIAPALVWTYKADYGGWLVSMAERSGDDFIKVSERVDKTGWLIVLMFQPFPRAMAVVPTYFFAQKMVERWTAVNWRKVGPRPWPTIKQPATDRDERIIDRAERG
jgi:hypothetical protein